MCDLAPAVDKFEKAFDWKLAAETGRIVPRVKGVDQALDDAEECISQANQGLQDFLAQERTRAKCPSMKYVDLNKDAYLLQLPASVLGSKAVPADYEKHSMTKDVVRFTCDKLEELKAQMVKAQELKEAAMANILTVQLDLFCRDWDLWRAAVSAAAELDVLISLAMASDGYCDGPVCTPNLRGKGREAGGKPFLCAKGLRHPCAPAGVGNGGFVPNDTSLGDDDACPAPFLLLTGPNMGGKSTYLRQVCLATVMAQIGADVPAAEFSLSPVDAIFVRMGAKDNILANQSTFLVELAETASVLHTATKHSLVALDELGRGTATGDGAAIAFAVLRHLVMILLIVMVHIIGANGPLHNNSCSLTVG
jgi:DNA mismatch repair protein MSH6